MRAPLDDRNTAADRFLSDRQSVVLYAELVDPNALIRRDEAIARERIQRVFKRLAATIVRYHGRVCALRDDSILAEFGRASDALAAALAFEATQREYLELIDDGIEPVVRIGMASGAFSDADDESTDSSVAQARRLAGLLDAGGICASAAIVESLAEAFVLEQEKLGESQQAGEDGPIEGYRVGLKSGVEPPPPTQVRKTRPLQPTSTMRTLNRFLLLAIILAAIFALLSAR